MKLTVEELKYMYLQANDLVKIVSGNKTVFSGNAFAIPWQYKQKTVSKLRAENEIRRKDWQQAGLWPPMNPEAAADVNLSDAEIRLYYVLTLE